GVTTRGSEPAAVAAAVGAPRAAAADVAAATAAGAASPAKAAGGRRLPRAGGRVEAIAVVAAGCVAAAAGDTPVTSEILTPGGRNSTVVTLALTICASSHASQFVSRTQPCDWLRNNCEGVAVPWMP